jgi:hypothetical protein
MIVSGMIVPFVVRTVTAVRVVVTGVIVVATVAVIVPSMRSMAMVVRSIRSTVVVSACGSITMAVSMSAVSSMVVSSMIIALLVVRSIERARHAEWHLVLAEVAVDLLARERILRRGTRTAATTLRTGVHTGTGSGSGGRVGMLCGELCRVESGGDHLLCDALLHDLLERDRVLLHRILTARRDHLLTHDLREQLALQVGHLWVARDLARGRLHAKPACGSRSRSATGSAAERSALNLVRRPVTALTIDTDGEGDDHTKEQRNSVSFGSRESHFCRVTCAHSRVVFALLLCRPAVCYGLTSCALLQAHTYTNEALHARGHTGRAC